VGIGAGCVLATGVLIGCGGGGAKAVHTTARHPPPARSAAPAAGRRRAGPRAADAAVARLLRSGRPVYCGGRRGRYAALTFDDGPGVYTGLAMRVLRRFHVPATFFLVGRVIPPYRQWPRREARANALGDHTFTHPLLTALTAAGVRGEIASARLAIERASGAPVRLFRPPYGGRNATVDATARALGLVEIMWNVDSGDSLGANYAQIVRNVRAGLQPGSIILMHENRGQTIRALRYYILPALRRSHLRLVTVPELLALDPPTSRQLAEGSRGCRLAGARTTGG
jgi:peptidoglycan/xylan/chitin deacetylase (PgdA/CDA1 family)